MDRDEDEDGPGAILHWQAAGSADSDEREGWAAGQSRAKVGTAEAREEEEEWRDEGDDGKRGGGVEGLRQRWKTTTRRRDEGDDDGEGGGGAKGLQGWS